MLSIEKLTQSANECLGWPYESPGTNNRFGIDCSGLLVKMYRDQGAYIYHGSNSIYHEYCSKTDKLTSVKQLKPGMVVFKWREWTDADKSNKWYGTPPGNLSHIGYVAGVNPLWIIHASSVAKEVTVDQKIGKWAYYGKLKAVDYGDAPEPAPTPTPAPEPVESKLKIVFAENGKPVNMRANPSLKANLIIRVPVGETVEWIKEDGAGWAYIKYMNKYGWMMDCYLVDEYTPTPEPEPEPYVDPAIGEEMSVWADNGKPVKLRAKPSTGCDLYDYVPVGATVVLVEAGPEWCKVNYGKRNGWYMMTKFLSRG